MFNVQPLHCGDLLYTGYSMHGFLSIRLSLSSSRIASSTCPSPSFPSILATTPDSDVLWLMQNVAIVSKTVPLETIGGQLVYMESANTLAVMSPPPSCTSVIVLTLEQWDIAQIAASPSSPFIFIHHRATLEVFDAHTAQRVKSYKVSVCITDEWFLRLHPNDSSALVYFPARFPCMPMYTFEFDECARDVQKHALPQDVLQKYKYYTSEWQMDILVSRMGKPPLWTPSGVLVTSLVKEGQYHLTIWK
jgi:hypothetical protein